MGVENGSVVNTRASLVHDTTCPHMCKNDVIFGQHLGEMAVLKFSVMV